MNDSVYDLSPDEIAALDVVIAKMKASGENFYAVTGPEVLPEAWVKEIVKEAVKAGVVEAAKEAGKQAVDWVREKIGQGLSRDDLIYDIENLILDSSKTLSLNDLLRVRNNIKG